MSNWSLPRRPRCCTKAHATRTIEVDVKSDARDVPRTVRLAHRSTPRWVLVHAHRADDSLGKAVAKIVRAELIVIDDIGLLPVGSDAAEGLYRIVEAAYERKSVAVSSNLHPSGFDELMPKTLATATVDRLRHHAHLCQTIGDSVRPAQALHGQGFKPLT